MNDKVSEQLDRIKIRQSPLYISLQASSIPKYGVAVLIVFIALSVTYLLQPFVFRTPLFLLSIMLITWSGGIGPGLLAVFLSTLFISVIFNPDGLVPTRFHDVPNAAAFPVTALLVFWWSLQRRQAQHALQQARAELENRVLERTTDLRQGNERLRNEIMERRRAEESLQKYNNRLETLHEIDEAILAAHSLEEIARYVLDRVIALAPCRLAIIMLFDFETSLQRVYAQHYAVGSGFLQSFTLPFSDSWVIHEKLNELRQGQVIVVDDLQTLPKYPIIQMAIDNGYQSCVIAPLLYRTELFGIFGVWDNVTGHINKDDVDTLCELANSLAIAMAQIRLFEDVSLKKDQLRHLTQQLIEAQEIERRQLARELHDRVGQNLSALNINLSIMSNRLTPDFLADVSVRIDDSLSLVEDTVESIRDVTTELTSSVLDEYGLASAIREYIQRYQQRTGIVVEFQGVIAQVQPEEQLALYRIAQELLTNVAKHARATHVTITLETVDQVRRMVIADNGLGFNPDDVHKTLKAHGLGLLSVRDRAESMGGHLHVESKPGDGTRVTVELKR